MPCRCSGCPGSWVGSCTREGERRASRAPPVSTCSTLTLTLQTYLTLKLSSRLHLPTSTLSAPAQATPDQLHGMARRFTPRIDASSATATAAAPMPRVKIEPTFVMAPIEDSSFVRGIGTCLQGCRFITTLDCRIHVSILDRHTRPVDPTRYLSLHPKAV